MPARPIARRFSAVLCLVVLISARVGAEESQPTVPLLSLWLRSDDRLFPRLLVYDDGRVIRVEASAGGAQHELATGIEGTISSVSHEGLAQLWKQAGGPCRTRSRISLKLSQAVHSPTYWLLCKGAVAVRVRGELEALNDKLPAKLEATWNRSRLPGEVSSLFADLLAYRGSTPERLWKPDRYAAVLNSVPTRNVLDACALPTGAALETGAPLIPDPSQASLLVFPPEDLGRIAGLHRSCPLLKMGLRTWAFGVLLPVTPGGLPPIDL